MLPGGLANLFMSSGSAPKITFLGKFSSSATYGIGPARSDRIIVVATQWESDGGTTRSVTVNSAAPDAYIFQALTADPMAVGYSVVPTGTSVTVAGTGDKSMAWMIEGVTVLDQVIGGAESGANVTFTIGALPAQPSAIIALARSRGAQGNFTISKTGSLRAELLDGFYTSGGGNSQLAGGSALADGSGSGTLTITGDNVYSASLSTLAIFR